MVLFYCTFTATFNTINTTVHCTLYSMYIGELIGMWWSIFLEMGWPMYSTPDYRSNGPGIESGMSHIESLYCKISKRSTFPTSENNSYLVQIFT